MIGLRVWLMIDTYLQDETKLSEFMLLVDVPGFIVQCPESSLLLLCQVIWNQSRRLGSHREDWGEMDCWFWCYNTSIREAPWTTLGNSTGQSFDVCDFSSALMNYPVLPSCKGFQLTSLLPLSISFFFQSIICMLTVQNVTFHLYLSLNLIVLVVILFYCP